MDDNSLQGLQQTQATADQLAVSLINLNKTFDQLASSQVVLSKTFQDLSDNIYSIKIITYMANETPQKINELTSAF